MCHPRQHNLDEEPSLGLSSPIGKYTAKILQITSTGTKSSHTPLVELHVVYDVKWHHKKIKSTIILAMNI
jgi:hypothetical protein